MSWKFISGKPYHLSSSGYWTPARIAATFLFFASDSTDILNKVVATQLPNQVSGSTDYLTVTGSGLNARYRTPDNATYRTADSDYVFWKTDASESTCDGNRLIGYDFPRILVKYLDVSPYTIQWIGILKVGVSVTNMMRDTFHLSIWWDNTLSFHGNNKTNRGIGQSIWTPESVYEDESIALFARMTSTPDDARKVIIDETIKRLKTAGLFAKADAFCFMAAHDAQAACLNWVEDDHNLTPINSPTFGVDTGYTGANTKYLKTDFIPSSDGDNYTLNSAFIAVYARKVDKANVLLMGCNPAGAGIDTYFYMTAVNWQARLNDGTDDFTAYINDTIGLFSSRRGPGANDKALFCNKTKKTLTVASGGVSTLELYILAWNNAGSPGLYTTNEASFWWIGGYLTDAEQSDLYDIAVDYYLTEVGAKI